VDKNITKEVEDDNPRVKDGHSFSYTINQKWTVAVAKDCYNSWPKLSGAQNIPAGSTGTYGLFYDGMCGSK
jgi:hypothetical protein